MKGLQKSSMVALSFMAKDQDVLAPGIVSLASASTRNTRPDKTMGGRNAKTSITAKPTPKITICITRMPAKTSLAILFLNKYQFNTPPNRNNKVKQVLTDINRSYNVR